MPSLNGVGVMVVTSTYLPFGMSMKPSRISSFTLALYSLKNSSSSSRMLISSATWAMGLISEARAMSKSEGTARTSLSEMGVFFESYYLREIAILGWNCSFDEVMIQVYGGSQKKEY
jgi:hypothetical protein